MLIAQSGEYIGQITGGCAEQAIVDHAHETLREGRNKTHRYGLNSPFFDIQLPCGSGIDVNFNSALDLNELIDLNEKLKARCSVLRTIDGFDKRYHPTGRIIAVGQGPILVSLTRLAISSGFDVLCVTQNDDESARVKQAGFQSVSMDVAMPSLRSYCDSYTALVSLFHEHELENSLLLDALESDAFYIGALGSKRTHANRLKQLRESGATAKVLARIRGPVGLDIEAITPEQIAISILAEVIRDMNQNG